jgi:AcrR family transcriptional regulator
MSTARSGRPPSEDLTGQARIRNAAITEFAAQGFSRANVRAIAKAAGVSPALIIHHFGSKAGLQTVCDEYVLNALLQRARDEAQPDSVRNSMRDYMTNSSDLHEQVQYMVRAINENSPSADKFVEALVEESEHYLNSGIADGSVRPTTDVRAMSVLTMLISLSLLTMPPAIARALGHESMNPEVMRRMAVPALELYTHGVYADDTMLASIYEALNDHPESPEAAAHAPSTATDAPTTTTAEATTADEEGSGND